MKQKHFRSANVRANSYDEDAGTIEVIWTAGAAVRRVGWDGEEYDEILSLEPGAVDLSRLNNGAPLLDSHQDSETANIVGVVVQGSAKIEGGRGIATILLSKALDVADIVTKIREGTARNVSVGYLIESIKRQDSDPPTVLVDRWTPIEISVCPVPADPNAQFRSASGRRTKPRSRAEAAAAYARGLLKPTQTREQVRGAAEARSVLGSISRLKPAAKVGKIDRRDVDAGAHEARKLLKGRR
jgi:phage head maturation protease